MPAWTRRRPPEGDEIEPWMREHYMWMIGLDGRDHILSSTVDRGDHVYRCLALCGARRELISEPITGTWQSRRHWNAPASLCRRCVAALAAAGADGAIESTGTEGTGR